MTKAEFVDALARDGRIGTKKEAARALDAILDTITEALRGGQDVNLTGFGKFKVAQRAPRQGVNPQTRERITIQGGRVPRFSAGSALKARVRGD